MRIYTSFGHALTMLTREMENSSQSIQTDSWQSIDIRSNPQAAMQELTNVIFGVALGHSDLTIYQEEIKPNLPWADQHFVLERVSRHPLNPGSTWKDWPWASSADKFRKEGEKFSHTYAERFWPKWANQTFDGRLKDERPEDIRKGIRYNYGDLNDVIQLLVRDPYTRQAYLPIWFPEDTGVVHRQRVPCTLGYHFLLREDTLNVFYPIRSCDFYRHFRDDLYLTVRLLLHVLSQMRGYDPKFDRVSPGMLTFWAGSLHMFIGDYQKLFKKNPPSRAKVLR